MKNLVQISTISRPILKAQKADHILEMLELVDLFNNK